MLVVSHLAPWVGAWLWSLIWISVIGGALEGPLFISAEMDSWKKRAPQPEGTRRLLGLHFMQREKRYSGPCLCSSGRNEPGLGGSDVVDAA